MDFSKSLMHCSTIAYFMASGKEKTPKQLWEDACAARDEWVAKYNTLDSRLQGMKTGINMQEKIKIWDQKVSELAPMKDVEPLSATAKSYLKRYYCYLRYGKWSASLDKGNKYTNKGKLGEASSIQLLSFLDNRPLHKNPERFNNDFLTGEPDVIFFDKDDVYLYDAKTSWDIETFTENLGKDLNPLYWWQMQGYYDLLEASSGEVSYCLVDTPEPILNQERYGLMRRMNVATDESPEYKEAEKILLNNLTFSDIPYKERRIKFIVERDEEAIEKIHQRVPLCREYLAEIQELHMQGVFKAKKASNDIIELA